MPQVYELWCLVTQIKVLEQSFHFEHEPKDLTALLKAIDPKKQKIAEYSKIDFKNSFGWQTSYTSLSEKHRRKQKT
jgi:hypothetical protein